MTSRWLVAITLLTASASAAGQVSASGPGGLSPASLPKVDRTTRSDEVAFRNERNDRLTVAVQVSGAGPYQFIVDTGADRTVIARELADRLRLAPTGRASIHSVTGISGVSTVKVPSLSLAGRPMKVADAPLLDGANIGADGMLGVDSLRSQRVVFDFEAKTLTIVPSAVRQYRDDPGTIVVTGTQRNGRLVLTDAHANGRPVSVVIDTGSQVTIGNGALRAQLLRNQIADPGRTVELKSVTGETIRGDFLFIRELEIGGVKLANLAVVFADAHTFERLKLDRRPALLLGMNAIRAFKKVSIDFAARKFKVVLPESSALDQRMAALP